MAIYYDPYCPHYAGNDVNLWEVSGLYFLQSSCQLLRQANKRAVYLVAQGFDAPRSSEHAGMLCVAKEATATNLDPNSLLRLE